MYTYVYVYITIEHVHILADLVTSSICQQRNSLVVLLLRSQGLPSEYAYNRIASLWKPPVDNIDSRMSLFCVHRATALVSALQSNSAQPSF